MKIASEPASSRLLRPLLALLLLVCAGPMDAQDESGAPDAANAQHAFDHAHGRWTKVLRAHTKGDRFDYGALASDRAEFDAYLAELSAVTPEALSTWSKEQRFAFWINAYNAFTVLKVVEEFPLDSIRGLDRAFGLKSVFDREWIPMRAHHPEGDNDDLSPNDIEHGILRKRFLDARLHAAINCASISCPPLRPEAFVAERLEEQLQEQMRQFILDPSRNELAGAQEGRIRVSEIFKWFSEDFKRDAGSVNEFLARFVPEDQRPAILAAKISYLDYDWDLNGTE